MLKAWNDQALRSLTYSNNSEGKPDRHLDPKGNRLVLKVTTKTKSWVWQASVNGTPRTITLGRYPGMGLHDARKKAGEIVADLDEGIDVYVKHGPGKAIAAKPTTGKTVSVGMTCQDAWDRYILALETGTNIHGRKAGNKPRTIIEKEGTWQRLFADQIGDSLLTEVAEDDVEEVIQQLRDDGLMGAANSSVRYIRAFMAWCIDERRLTGLRDSPARFLKTSRLTPRSRTLSNNELRWLWAALDAKSQHGYDLLDWRWRSAYRLAILTGQRRQEIFGLARSEVDQHRQVLVIPANRMKPGREHVVPLGPSAWQIVKEALEATNSQFLFPSFVEGEVERHISGYSKIQRRVRGLVENEAAKEKQSVAHWTFHDIRRTYSTGSNAILDDQGNRCIAKDYIERVMSHVLGGVEGAYDRWDYLAEKKRALGLWESEVDRIITSATN